MTRTVGLLVIAGLLLLASRPAGASCAPLDSPQQNLQRSDAVFSGEAVSVGDNLISSLLGSDYSVTFNVIEAWKGATTTTITISNKNDLLISGGSSVEFPFEQGQQYLVYAYRDSETGALGTNGCVGTRLLADAAADLRELGPPTITLPPAPAQRSSPWAFSITTGLLVLSLIVLLIRHQRRSRQP